MKLNSTIKVKASQKLFDNTYKFKTVILCPGGYWFRGNNLSVAEEMLEKWREGSLPKHKSLRLKDQTDHKYCADLLEILKSCENYSIRVEHPLLSFYTNNYDNAVNIANLDPTNTKYVSAPPEGVDIIKNQVLVKRINHDFKVTVGKTLQSYPSFVEWAEKTKKVKMTKSCKEHLLREQTWGGFYFYVKDESAMTIVKMFIGNNISKIDKVVKTDK